MSNDYMTQAEVAKALGISRSRVSQIESRALRKLKRSAKLRAFYDIVDDWQEYYGEEYEKVPTSDIIYR